MCTNRIEDRKTGKSWSCRRCDQCRQQACNDIKGRLCCEHRTALLKGWKGYFVTLTYGSDDRYYGEHQLNPRSQSFYWDDIVEWRKRLWNGGFPHRLYVVGEVGDDRGRVHWHVVVWFTDGVPPNIILSTPGSARFGLRGDYKRYVHWLKVPEGLDVFAKVNRDPKDTSGGTPLWTHGWSVWEELTDDTIGYTTSYLYKNGRPLDTGIGGRGYCGRKFYGGSLREPLGSEYFRTIEAPRYIEAGLSPQKPIYRLLEVRKRNGELFDFFLPIGATRTVFLDAFVRGWVAAYGNDLWPQSDMVDAHCDDMARRARRAAGVPDMPDGEFNDDFYRRRFEKNGGWAKLNKVSAEDRERHWWIRQMQDAGIDIDVPSELAKLLGPGHNQHRKNREAA